MKHRRNSSIELLKLITIIIIVIGHSFPSNLYLSAETAGKWFIDLNIASSNINNIVLIVYSNFFNFANTLFVICSAYFLIDNGKVSLKKIFYMIMDTWVISIFFLILTLLFRYEVNIKLLIKQLFPILFQNNWFVTCYIMFYILHPVLNMVVKRLKQRELLQLNIILFILYCCIYTLLHNDIFYNNLVGFIIIYLFVSYVKLYMPAFSKDTKRNVMLLIISSILNFLLSLSVIFIGLKVPMFKDNMHHFAIVINPLYLIMSISLFNLFKNREFYNKKINYFSSLSLLIYLFSENILFKRSFFRDIYTYIYNTYTYRNIIPIIAVMAGLLLIISTGLAVLYKEVFQNKLHNIGFKVLKFPKKVFEAITDKLIEIV